MQFIDGQYQTMPWEIIDSVVFDIGNVLVTFDPPAILGELFPDDAALRDELLHRIYRSPYWIELDRGTLTPEEAAVCMAQGREELRPVIEQTIARGRDLKRPIAAGVDVLRMCKARGKRLYILSNYPRASFERLPALFDFFSLFDGATVSSYLHLLKPDPAIYQALLTRFGLDPARTLFLDDTRANVEAAVREGIQGFWVESQEKLRRFFAP